MVTLFVVHAIFALSVIESLFYKNKTRLWITLYMCFILAFVTDIIRWSHVVAIIISGSLYYLANLSGQKGKTVFAFVIKKTNIILLLCCIFGIVPAFKKGVAIWKEIYFSQLSCPYHLNVNLPLNIMVLLYFICSDLYKSENNVKLNCQVFKQTFFILCMGVIAVLGPALFSGYIMFDTFAIREMLSAPQESVKLQNLGIWAFYNIFFCVFREEVLFRGCLQRWLKTKLENNKWQSHLWGQYLHIILISFVFGLWHLRGGVTYMLLAVMCSVAYGYAYEKTATIVSAIVIHFAVNLVHFLLFTYPNSLLYC